MFEKMITHIREKLEWSRMNIERWAELNEPKVSEEHIRKTMHKVIGMRTAVYPLRNENEELRQLYAEINEVRNAAIRYLNGGDEG